MSVEARPAFYALAPGGWRDYLTLLHPPYTLWHLSYVAVGATLAPVLHPWRLFATAAAFFLALGVGAHALDELRGRPLRTAIPSRALVALAVVSIAGAVAIGVVTAIEVDLWLLAFVAFGAFVVCAYNLELFGGRLHDDAWFAVDWGAFPVLTAYFTQAHGLAWETGAAAAFAFLLSLAQRRLSTQVRLVRRQVRAVSGEIELDDGQRVAVDRELLMAAPEAALRLLAGASVALAASLLLLRLA